MREIKFRAWIKDIKMMRYEIRIGDEVPPEIIQESVFMQYTGLKDKNGKEIYEGDIVVYPDTYTESVDVGVGMVPVAQTEENSFGEVKFEQGTFGIMCPSGGETLESGFNSFWWIVNEYGFELNELEVIGNIYENPELLKD